MNLDLPEIVVSDRVSRTTRVDGGTRVTLAELDGPGCIRHIALVLNHPRRDPLSSRKAILRIFFDDEPVPYVEAPAGDFFGVMHGEGYYDINSAYLSVKAWNGYNAYFPMPFAHAARIELEAAPGGTAAYLQVDWHRYPGQEMPEKKRFCARWRREMPTRRYSDDYLILDADGPGQLLGFVYGVRLLDNVDRWSHGGADNIYIDGQGEHPAFIRGIGGEDCFGCGYGGNLHPPDSHLYEGVPFYTHDDQGMARPAPRLVGYRFFVQDSIAFRESIQFRFGCMENDICSTVYWYQEGPVRPFFTMPPFDKLVPATELPRGTCDLPLPSTGEWLLAGPIENREGEAMRDALPGEDDFSLLDWIPHTAYHGFVDVNHFTRPHTRGAGVHHRGVVALARCTIEAPSDMTASVSVTWDDELVVLVNNESPVYMDHHYAFRSGTIDLPLHAGKNTVILKLSNEAGSNHGGWAFAFRCTTPEGEVLLPRAE